MAFQGTNGQTNFGYNQNQNQMQNLLQMQQQQLRLQQQNQLKQLQLARALSGVNNFGLANINPLLLAQLQVQQLNQMKQQQLQQLAKQQQKQQQQLLLKKLGINQEKKNKKFSKKVKKSQPASSLCSGNSSGTDESPIVPHRRIIAINLPDNIQSIDTVTGVFHPYGDVSLVKVLKPGKTLPSDVKSYLSRVPDLGRTVCALIDFETARAAKFAVHVLRQRENEAGFRCALLKNGVEEKLYGERMSGKITSAGSCSSDINTSDSGITSEDGSAASAPSTSASEISDTETLKTETDSDSEMKKERKMVKEIANKTVLKYSREYLLGFEHKSATFTWPNMEVVKRTKVSPKSEPIRQSIGPKDLKTRGFRLARNMTF